MFLVFYIYKTREIGVVIMNDDLIEQLIVANNEVSSPLVKNSNYTANHVVIASDTETAPVAESVEVENHNDDVDTFHEIQDNQLVDSPFREEIKDSDTKFDDNESDDEVNDGDNEDDIQSKDNISINNDDKDQQHQPKVTLLMYGNPAAKYIRSNIYLFVYMFIL